MNGTHHLGGQSAGEVKGGIFDVRQSIGMTIEQPLNTLLYGNSEIGQESLKHHLRAVCTTTCASAAGAGLEVLDVPLANLW